MLLQSGVFERDGELEHGPELDGAQTGYGPGYRIYEAGDGRWLALVIRDEAEWQRLGDLSEVTSFPEAYVSLRGVGRDDAAGAAERALEDAFATAPAADWVERLRGLGLLVEPIAEVDRDQFRRGILDDPVNRGLGRAVAYETADWGHFEQIGPLVRCGPSPGSGPRLMLPGVGEHTVEVLTELGFSDDEVGALLDAGVARQS
jgi:crotonobetainyl-CoA:carnitine CoA-transferase CaiB-like acyl-CoA transferase